MKFQLLTDSSCDLPYQLFEKEQVHSVSMVVTVDDKEHIDDSGKTFDSQWLMKEMQEGKLASTSQINLGVYLEKFKELLKVSELPIIYLAFSSGLSGSYANAQSALLMLQEEQGEVPITIIDSLQASLGEGLLVKELIRLRNQGASVEEAVEKINFLKKHVQSWVTVDDLKHLERGGRISKSSATVGSLMNIKPIITVNAEGKLVNQAKVRGRKKALDKLVEGTREAISLEHTTEILIAHADDQEAGDYLVQELSTLNKPIELMLMGPTIASHTGKGALAVFSIRK